MFKIRHPRKEDYPGIYEANRRAFDGEKEGTLVDKLRLTNAYIPELEYVAEAKDRIIGHVFFSIVHIRTDLERIPVLALAPLAVVPDYQRKGVGYNLVTEALKKARSMGYRAVLVIGHPQYYPRFGFKPCHEKLSVKWPVPAGAFMGLELIPGALVSVKGKVEYPALFDETV